MLAAFLLTLCAPAAAAQGDLLRSRPARALVDEVIELAPAAGHHFNAEAPQKCGGEKAQASPRRFRCQMKASGRVEVVASVCDDAKTFCRQERFAVEVSGPAPAAKREKAAVRAHPAPEGFLLDRPAEALARARRENALLYVHFFGIWCPPCNMLEESVYPSEEFRRASQGFVKLALDADAELSWEWKGRYKIGGYPTLLVLDGRGREIARAVGYRPPGALSSFLAEARGLTREPVEDAARAVAKAAPAAEGARRARVARWRLERGEHAEAAAAAGSAPEAAREALLARRSLAEKADDPAGADAALRALIAARPEDPDFIGWAADLAERDKAAAASLAEAVAAAVRRETTEAALARSGALAGDVLSVEASYWEAVDRPVDAQAAWNAAAESYAEAAKSSRLALARGANMERAYCLRKAGRPAEARALYESLIGAYPDEFTFHYGYGGLLLELKETDAALASARAAVKSGYGDNWLRAVRLEARALKELGRKDEAAKAIDAALAEAAAPKSTAVRTHRYLADLRRLRAEL